MKNLGGLQLKKTPCSCIVHGTLYNTKEQVFRYKLHGMAYPGPFKLDFKNLKPPALETAVHYSEGQYSIVRHTTQLSGSVCAKNIVTRFS